MLRNIIENELTSRRSHSFYNGTISNLSLLSSNELLKDQLQSKTPEETKYPNEMAKVLVNLKTACQNIRKSTLGRDDDFITHQTPL